ncbi:peroxiredoxin [Angustibacter sp. McL0619]|uniref:peroxiredoxin n=1 Tax=Angustibacter sp. McL0619 TaxID=3415676 RepID=UPI003CE70260
MTLTVGDLAPDFTLKSQHGEAVSLSAFRGERAVLVVFYPFAFSGTCTGELCALRDDLSAFQNDDVQLLAVSCDPVFSLKAWAADQGYEFPLLSDFWPHGAAATAYGVFDTDAGRATRGTFLVDVEGKLAWSVVNGPGQARDPDAYRKAIAAL